jgi:antibiotic biosynthesis monooxygenase (ABM) superfamily enzyme
MLRKLKCMKDHLLPFQEGGYLDSKSMRIQSSQKGDAPNRMIEIRRWESAVHWCEFSRRKIWGRIKVAEKTQVDTEKSFALEIFFFLPGSPKHTPHRTGKIKRDKNRPTRRKSQ